MKDGKKKKHLNCKECGKEFEIRRWWQKFCSRSCRWKAWDRNHPRMERIIVVFLFTFLLVSNAMAEPRRERLCGMDVMTGHPDANLRHFQEMILVGEAADQGFEGLYATGCVLRNRNWDTRGFSSAKRKDLHDFYLRQPQKVRYQVAQVVKALYHGGPDTTEGATHFESDRFAEPKWAREMIKTCKIKNHVFYRSKD